MNQRQQWLIGSLLMVAGFVISIFLERHLATGYFFAMAIGCGVRAWVEQGGEA